MLWLLISYTDTRTRAQLAYMQHIFTHNVNAHMHRYMGRETSAFQNFTCNEYGNATHLGIVDAAGYPVGNFQPGDHAHIIVTTAGDLVLYRQRDPDSKLFGPLKWKGVLTKEALKGRRMRASCVLSGKNLVATLVKYFGPRIH